MYIFDRLKEERERLKYNQTAFAALVDASKQAQINWEKGVATPNAAALATWAEVGMDVLYVVTGAHARLVHLPADEQMWLDCYREWSPEVKKRELRRAMGVVAEGSDLSAPPTPSMGNKNVNNNQSGMTMTNSAPGGVQVGYAGGKVAVKKGR